MERWDPIGLALAREYGQTGDTASSGLGRELARISPFPQRSVINSLLRLWIICHVMEID